MNPIDTQPDALRLAKELESGSYSDGNPIMEREAALELRRLHTENLRLQMLCDTDKASADHWRAECEKLREEINAVEWHTPERHAELERLRHDGEPVTISALAKAHDIGWSQKEQKDAQEILGLVATIKYLVGIAERGEGRKCRDDEIPERFVLDYVQRLEAELDRLRQAQGGEAVAWFNPITKDLILDEGDAGFKGYIPLYTAPLPQQESQLLEAAEKYILAMDAYAKLMRQTETADYEKATVEWTAAEKELRAAIAASKGSAS